MGSQRIVLVDDHVVVREGLKALVSARSGMTVVGEAADGMAACHEVKRLRPDVVVMDVSMPKFTGSQATEWLTKECPDVKVLALTVHEDRGYIRQLLGGGRPDTC